MDSGASINVIDESSLAKFKTKPTLAKASTQIFPYASDTPMTTLGVFHEEIASARKLAEAKIFVVKGSCGSLLGYKFVCWTQTHMFNEVIQDITMRYLLKHVDGRLHPYCEVQRRFLNALTKIIPISLEPSGLDPTLSSVKTHTAVSLED